MPDQPDAISLEPDHEDAEEFVRTFATDAAAVQSGKVPDFTKSAGAPEEPAPLRAAPAAGAAPGPAEHPQDAASLPPSLTPEWEPAAAPVPLPAAPLHTYKSDFADEIKEKDASQADILAAEQDRPRAAPLPAAKRDFPLVALASVLIAIGAAGAVSAYWYTARSTTVAVVAPAALRIFVDESQTVSGTGDELAAQIMQSVAKPPAENAVRLLALASSSESVFEALALPAPDILLRNLESAGSLAGVVNAGGAASPFFILSVDSYSDTFAGMLDWEPTMAHDLAPLYPPVGTSTPSFKDEVILNHDIRALVDSNGETVLLYGYFDQNTLIIARDENAFALLLDRLTNSHTQQ